MHFSVQYLEDDAGQGKADPELRPSKKGNYQEHVLRFRTLFKYGHTKTSY